MFQSQGFTEEAYWAWETQQQQMVAQPSVPLDQPLSIQCNVDYEINMDKFPGLAEEQSGITTPEFALQFLHRPEPPQVQRQETFTPSTAFSPEIQHRSECAMFADLPATSNDWANRLVDIASSSSSESEFSQCSDFYDLCQLSDQSLSPDNSDFYGNIKDLTITNNDDSVERCLQSLEELSQCFHQQNSNMSSDSLLKGFMCITETCEATCNNTPASVELYDSSYCYRS